jgi:hypothetical protein
MGTAKLDIHAQSAMAWQMAMSMLDWLREEGSSSMEPFSYARYFTIEASDRKWEGDVLLGALVKFHAGRGDESAGKTEKELSARNKAAGIAYVIVTGQLDNGRYFKIQTTVKSQGKKVEPHGAGCWIYQGKNCSEELTNFGGDFRFTRHRNGNSRLQFVPEDN